MLIRFLFYQRDYYLVGLKFRNSWASTDKAAVGSVVTAAASKSDCRIQSQSSRW